MKPSLAGELDFAKASYQSAHGKIESYWKKEGQDLSWEVKVPGNSTAIIYVPADSIADVKESNSVVSKSKEIKYLRTENGYVLFEIGSGSYQFSTRLNKSL